MVLGVVPDKELLAKAASVLLGAEAIRKVWSILQGFEMAFREGVVVGGMRSAVGLGHTQIGQQKSQRLGRHRSTTIHVNVELAWNNSLLLASFGDELFGQFFAFPIGPHPSHDITAEDVEDDIQIEIRPLGGPQQLGDVPTPELIGSGGQQLRFLIGRMDELVAAFALLALLLEQTVHSAG